MVRRPRTRTDLRTLIKRGKSETPSSSVSTEDSRNLSDVRSDETQSAYDADEAIVNLGQIAGFHQIAVGTGEDFLVLGPRPGMQTSETFFSSSPLVCWGKLLCCQDCCKDIARIKPNLVGECGDFCLLLVCFWRRWERVAAVLSVEYDNKLFTGRKLTARRFALFIPQSRQLSCNTVACWRVLDGGRDGRLYAFHGAGAQCPPDSALPLFAPLLFATQSNILYSVQESLLMYFI